MGLDQTAEWISTNEQGEEVSDTFQRWRKHSHIQNWMQKLYAKKTGIDNASEFNCVGVELTKEDILQFIEDVNNDKLQCVDGFFFGCSYDTMLCRDEDIDFACEALKHVFLGKKVVYSSWW